MPVLKKKNRTDNARRTTMPNFPDNPEIPEMSAMRVKDIPYDNTPAGVDKKPDMDMPRSMLLHDMAKVAHKKPFKDELKQRYHIYKDISEYFDSKAHKKCDILPVCGNCGGENTHRLTYAMTVQRSKWFVETENYCVDCGKYTSYDFAEPDHDFRGIGEQTVPFIGQIHPRAKKMLPIVNAKLKRWRDTFGPDYEWPETEMIDVNCDDGSWKVTTEEEQKEIYEEALMELNTRNPADPHPAA